MAPEFEVEDGGEARHSRACLPLWPSCPYS
uniref:Uncharacterized protein n=1 Tax=Arundo donax TaxID=35708 RepID=A0A0A9B486_ARUDO